MRIALIPGDGIGPEVTAEAVKVLRAIGEQYAITLSFDEVDMGGVAIDRTGVPLPQETIDTCASCDAVFLGAVGGPQWDGLPGHLRPEAGLLGLRKALGVYANLRPAILFPQLTAASTLRAEVLAGGLDLLVVRELTGGIYFGDRGREGQKAWDTECYSTDEIRRVARVAFESARKRGGHLMSIDKANVLESSRLWRETVVSMSAEYPDVELDHMYVDNAAMQLIRNPKQFDVILTNNIFGDILSDEASMLTGSLGMLPSASLGDGGIGLYEPIHGSAPDIAGKDLANPIAAIMSIAMLLRYSAGQEAAAQAVEKAVSTVLDRGYRTADLTDDGKAIGTQEMGDLIVEALLDAAKK